MSKTYSFALGGGLDEISQPLALNPGRMINCLNHEVVESGYALCEGIERFDGRVNPTEFPFWLLGFAGGELEIEDGDAIVGATSGATATALLDADLTGGAWSDGDAQGFIGLRALVGSFVVNEDILVGGIVHARAAATEIVGAAQSGNSYEEDTAEAARDFARALIQAPPGSGPVRGVWELSDTIYAVRDNEDATQAFIYRATAAGWTLVPLGDTLAFTSGGASEIGEGDVITGATSNASATVERVVVESGDWPGGTAQGYFVLSGIVGAFAAENLNTAEGSNLATISAAPIPTLLPPGGRYFTIINNFYGSSATRRIYGANGVSRGFEFDGEVFTPLRTGMEIDTPTRVAVHRNQLFFSFPGGTVQHSAPGEPQSYEAILGSAALAIGSEIADFIMNVDSLQILGEHGIYALTGNDVTDWVLSPITLEAGARPFTGQRIGPGLYLDNRGLRSITASQAYGNFAMGTVTETVKKTMKRKSDNGVQPCASVVVRSKNHYRLFYEDGSGFSFYLGRKFPEPAYFDIGKPVRCITSSEGSDGVERIFFGSDDGFVYQLDRGTSLDGASIEAFIQLPYANMGSPNVLKRPRKVSLEAVANGGSEIGIAVEFDYSANEQLATSQSTVEAQGAGGLWGVANWSEFFWSSPVENVLEAEVEGQGRNASIIAYSNSARTPPYVLRGATFYFNERGRVR